MFREVSDKYSIQSSNIMKKTLLLLPALALGTVAAHGQVLVIYEEAFLRTNSPSGNRLLNQSWAADGHYKGNWRVYDAQGNNDNSFSGHTGVNNDNRGRMLSNGTGGDDAIGFIFNQWTTANLTANFRDGVAHGIVYRDNDPVFNSGGGITANHFEWQNLRGFSVDLSRGTGAVTETASTRAVIQIGTDWFASETTFNPTATNTWETHTLANISTANWLTLSFDSDNNNAVTLGTTAQTLAAHNASGIVASVGFHVSNTATTGNNTAAQYRIDNIVVTAIPEPSTYAALIGLLALGLVAWRRRSR
jgi:hypothetical protein